MDMALQGKHVLVMGLGLFGGGVGAVRFLVREGAQVTVTDLRSAQELDASVKALNGLSVVFKLGGHDETDFQRADLVVANPAVPRSSSFLKAAEMAGVPVTTEINLFVSRCPAKVIGITGSSGKTTTTSLIGAMLKRKDPRTLIGGNIGKSLLDDLDKIEVDAPVVLELSSFQLDRLGELPWSPHIAVVTNFAPNHIDVHGSLEAYKWAKKQIVLHQSPHDWAVVNGDDAEVSGWVIEGKRVVFCLDGKEDVFVRGGEIRHAIRGIEKTVCSAADLKLPGQHNLANALSATGAAVAWGVSEMHVAAILKAFEGVPHRLERVGVVRGVMYVNDSIATSPDRTHVALNAFDGKLVLIAGGYDKGIAFDGLGPVIGQRVVHLIVLGKTAEAIAASVPEGAQTQIHRVKDLTEAVDLASTLAQPGATVLLSPASASYDQFRNFEERGQRFRELVWGIEKAEK